MKLLKGIGKLTYRVFHPVKAFITSKVGELFINLKEKYNVKKELKGKLFTDEQFNEILLSQGIISSRKSHETHDGESLMDWPEKENIVSFDKIREEKEVTREKININELVHEYLKNSRIDAFGAEKIFEGIDKIEELGKTDELVNYINESSNIIPDKRYQKLLDKMYDIVNNVKDEENIDIFDYLSVYLPDDLSDEQRLNVYQTATKAIEDNKSNEDKIREYLDSKKYYMPASSIDKYIELMHMLESLTNIDELDSDDRVEVIEELAEINDFDATKRDDSKKINEKNINNVDEAFALYRNGEISKEEFKEVMEVAKKDDEIIRKSITEKVKLPEVIETKVIEENIKEKSLNEDELDSDSMLEATYRKQLDKISKAENDYKELNDKIKYYEEFLKEHDLSHEEDQEMKKRMEDKLSELKKQYNEFNSSNVNSINSKINDKNWMMGYYTQVSKKVEDELKTLEIDKQIKVLTALKEDIILTANSEEIKNYNSRKKELLEIKKECLERKAKIQSYYDEKTKELTKAWVYFK